jgi:hypothetical protein
MPGEFPMDKKMASPVPVAVLAVAMAICTGCSAHYYEGKVAILDSSPAVAVVKHSKDWGDCYRRFGSIPTVYRIDRPDYVLDIVHGQRYWAELFFVARTHAGAELAIAGKNVAPVRYRSGGDMRRLRESRGVFPAYETGSLKASMGSLVLTITGEDGKVIGTETISYRVDEATCFELDSI